MSDASWITIQAEEGALIMRNHREETAAALGRCCLPSALLMSIVFAFPAMADDVLVESGQARSCIVFPQGTEKGRVLTAAHDLAGYLQTMSGARTPIIAFVCGAHSMHMTAVEPDAAESLTGRHRTALVSANCCDTSCGAFSSTSAANSQ